jgi:hypothetical protein
MRKGATTMRVPYNLHKLGDYFPQQLLPPDSLTQRTLDFQKTPSPKFTPRTVKIISSPSERIIEVQGRKKSELYRRGHVILELAYSHPHKEEKPVIVSAILHKGEGLNLTRMANGKAKRMARGRKIETTKA